MLDELKHSLRALRRSPLSSLSAIGILAVAIGASAAVFTVVDKVLIRPLPLKDPHRIVVIWPRETANQTTIGEISNAVFRRWRQEVRSLQSLVAIGSTNWSLILREGEPATLPVAAVSGDFFPLVVGAPAATGRTLRPDDERINGGRVAVMSHGTWVRRFGADPGIVGRSLRFESGVYTIVGIMPDGFDYPRGAELWVPLLQELADSSAEWKVDTISDPAWGALWVLGRLTPGMSIDAARSEISALIARDARIGCRPGMEAVLTPLDEHIFGNTRPALVALASCVGLVLLIGCANVAVLLLVRNAGRAEETATRLAIGATRWRVVRQSLSDALVLTCLGGAIGHGFAYGMFKLLLALAPLEVPRLGAARFDGLTVAFTVMLCLTSLTVAALATPVAAQTIVGSAEDAIRLGGLLPDIIDEIPKHLSVQNTRQREFLRFSTTHWNFGDGALQVRGGGQGSPCLVDGVQSVCTFAKQEILDANGQIVALHDAGVALFHPEHNHWHQSEVAEFAIRETLDGTPVGSLVFKTTFCLIDLDSSDLVHEHKTKVYWDCDADLQGISVGYGDPYHHSLEGQEIDITGLPAGDYYLTFDADPAQHWLELDDTNNRSWAKFRLGRQGANPSVTVLETCGYEGNTSNN